MKQKTGRKLLSFLLTLALVLGLIPGMSLTAYATETLLTTLTFGGSSTYSETTSGVVSVTATNVKSYSAQYGWLFQNGTTVTVEPVGDVEITKVRFRQNDKDPVDDDKSPFTLTFSAVNGGSVDASTGTVWAPLEMDGVTSIEVYRSSPHTHSFTYSASGATITATCGAQGCGLLPSTEGGSDHVTTLIIVKPTLTTYGETGKSADATITDANSIKGSAAVSYYKANDAGTDKVGTALTGAPTDAGKYWAEITLTNTENNSTATAHVVYTIAKAVPATPTDLTATYGQTLSDVELPNGWTWADAETTSAGNVGDNTFKASFAEDDNYNAASNVDVTVTVSKATPVISAEDKSVKINKTVSLGATVSPEVGVTWGYTSNNESIATVSTDGVVTGVAEGSTTITISATATATDATNYNNAENKTVNITVFSKNLQTITASDVTATYGDTNKSVSATVSDATSGQSSGTGTLSYAVKSGDAVTVNDSTGALTIVKAGTATVTVTAAATNTGGEDNSGYAEVSRDVNVTVKPKDITITAQNKNIFVDGTVPDLSNPALDTDYTVAGLVVGDALSTAPTLAYKKNEEAVTPASTTTGTYDIVPSGAIAGANYSISYVNGTLTISEKQPATVTKVPTAKTLTYTGSAQALVTAGSATGGEMQYALGTATEATEQYTTSIPSKTNAGTYYVWYKAVGDENHNDSEPDYVTSTIKKKSAPVSVYYELILSTTEGASGEPTSSDKQREITDSCRDIRDRDGGGSCGRLPLCGLVPGRRLRVRGTGVYLCHAFLYEAPGQI